MQRFPEFVSLARRWPVPYPPRFQTWRTEYEACLMMGCTEEQIISGTRYWLENCVPQNTADFKPLAPHNFLREQSFMAYLPEETELKLVK